MSLRVQTYRGEAQKLADLSALVTSIGVTSAAATALLFRLPLPRHIAAIFEDALRQEVTAELLKVPGLRAAHVRQLEELAWLTFQRRMVSPETAPRSS